MTVRVLPDTEAITIAYLLTRPEVTSLVGGSEPRIGSTLDLTGPTVRPALRVTRVSAVTVARRHLRAGNVQLEAFAPTELEARDLCETAWAAMFEDPPSGPFGVFDGLGVVTGVDPAIDPRSQLDPATETPRWLASVIVYAHPIPE